MRYFLALFILIFSTNIEAAQPCSEKLLLENAWKHVKSGDVYVLESGGDMKCRNEKRHRGECDYVYTSDFIGIPESWELTQELSIIIKFDTGVFKTESVEYKCSYNPSEKRLYLGELFFLQTQIPIED